MQTTCRLLSVSESGYYEWRRRPPSARAVRHAWLTEQIQAVHTASHGTYGIMRVHAELTLGLGLQVGHNQVGLLMARAGIKGLPGNRRPRPRHETPTATDLVERMFTRDAPNRLWVTDITEHRTYEGKLYCAVVLDIFPHVWLIHPPGPSLTAPNGRAWSRRWDRSAIATTTR